MYCILKSFGATLSFHMFYTWSIIINKYKKLYEFKFIKR